MKEFGCIVYVHVPNELKTNLNPKAGKCVFIGYSLAQEGCRCYNPTTWDVNGTMPVMIDRSYSILTILFGYSVFRQIYMSLFELKA